MAYELTGEDQYWEWYQRIHEYSWNHFPDPGHIDMDAQKLTYSNFLRGKITVVLQPW